MNITIKLFSSSSGLTFFSLWNLFSQKYLMDYSAMLEPQEQLLKTILHIGQ